MCLVETKPVDPPAEAGVTLTCTWKLGCIIPLFGASEVPSRDVVECKGMARGVDINGRNGAARGIHMGYQKYHCGAKLAILGG